MSVDKQIPGTAVLADLADESGIAAVVLDEHGSEVWAANNNSICKTLNPDGKMAGQCAAFCGTALEETRGVGGAVSFTCHAGLECRALPVGGEAKPLVAIIGRTFVSAENYRKATQRAISGDWSEHPPADFFENILLSGSTDIVDKAARKAQESLAPVKASAPPEEKQTKPSPEAITNIVERFNREIGLGTEPTPVEATPDPEPKPESRSAEASAWRSFFTSLLQTDYPGAVDSILAFLAHQYGFSALIWLEKEHGRLESTAAFGEMKNRKVRLGIAAGDERLVAAMQSEMPLELGERSKGRSPSQRVMNLFPIGVGDDIAAAIAVLDPITDDRQKKQIVRIGQSLAPQLEILRLRSEVAIGETLSSAVRRFSDSLRKIDGSELWLELTQSAAEMLRAERASLMIYDEKADVLEIKAMIGAKAEPPPGVEIGGRVSRIVLEKGQPVAVTDVSRTGLPAVKGQQHYRTPSFLCCPIAAGGRTLGVMNFTDRACGKPFDRASLELFEAIAPQLGVAIDRALLKEKAGAFEQLSVTDSLTGLLNRRYIEERLMEEVKRSNRHGFPMSFMMLDVDHFKSYNDEFGHPAGDDALKIVANVIRDTLRAADVAARFGGEEFSILLPQTTGEEAAAIAERIRHNVETAAFPHRRVTLSIGVANCSAELCSSPNIVSAADKALYEAKRGGRNRVKVFEEMNGNGQPVAA